MTAKGCCSDGGSTPQKQLFPVWAEESADLGNNSAEWAFGNGNDTPTNQGFTLPFDCKLVAMSLSLEGAVSCEVELWKNNVASGKKVNTVNDIHGYRLFNDPQLEFSAGDYFAFKTVIGHADSNAGVVCAWFEREV